MITTETDVAIVGAGPCGLMLAIELGRRGIRAQVIDQEADVATAPQANATQARSMEHYRRLGFADEIRALGLPQDYPTDIAYFTTYTGYELARYEQPPSRDAAQRAKDLAHIWNSAELAHRIPQSYVEHKLLEKAAELDEIDVIFLHKATGFLESANGVVLSAEHVESGEKREIHAKYIFGADGTRSVIREQLGFAYSGAGGEQRDFMGGRMRSIYLEAPTFYDVVKAPPAWMYWCFNRRRRALLAATDGHGHFVLLTQLQPGDEEKEITNTEAARLFYQALGMEIPVTVHGMATWFAGRGLVADSFQQGRVFLGGDAAHIFTPTGGMGYNTAIEDAVNIGWKIAAVLKSEAAPSLLDSYQVERRPVALRNTRFALAFADSVGLYRPSPAIEDKGSAGDAARARAGAYLLQHGAAEFSIPGFTFGARYDGSPVIADDTSLAPPDAPSVYVPCAKPGGRPPHVWLTDGASLFDQFGFGWTLLCVGDSDAIDQAALAIQTEAQQRGLSFKRLDIKHGRDRDCLFDLYEAPLTLIRPDHIVAWRGDGVDPTALFDLVTGRPVA